MSNENNLNKPEQPIQNEEAALAVYEGMNEVFEHTRCIVESMQQGEKITVRDLVDKVSAEVSSMGIGNVHNLVQMFLKKRKDVTVEIGRGGGVFKGGKPKRVDSRPRCITCNQVLRPEMRQKQAAVEQLGS